MTLVPGPPCRHPPDAVHSTPRGAPPAGAGYPPRPCRGGCRGGPSPARMGGEGTGRASGRPRREEGWVDRRERIIKELLVEPGTDANIAGRDHAWNGGAEFEQLSAKELKATAKELLARGVEELSQAQELLWASGTSALLVVFQAIDAAGKDSTIEHVMSGVNPQGVQVVSFRQPSSEELDHDFLWRISRALPERGRIGIFNRSHYE